jgi:formate dehydrogenase subunit gamma
MISNPGDLPRYTPSERANHWMTAVCFILLAFSGLAFFHPLFWPFAQFFGGGVWTRILHPFFGIVLVILFASMFGRFRAANRMTSADWEWLRRIREVAGGDDRNMPPQGRYNAGQKVLFWAVSFCLLLMLLSGLFMWRAFFNFPVTIVRLAAVAHAAIGALFIILIMGHVYAAIWTRGTIRGMLYGTVTRAWARQHHEIWFREMTKRWN